MRVLVAGASGAIGRRLVPQLVEAGHEVAGTTRSAQAAARIGAVGAEPVIVDALDAHATRTAVAEARPEVIVHELTALPDRFNPRDKHIYDASNRIRTEGTRNLIAAAHEAGVRRFVCQSIAFAYAPGGDRVKTEDAPLFRDAPEPFGRAVSAVADMEGQVLGAEGIEGLVLRYGWFYGAGTYYGAGGSSESEVRRRRFPVIGEGAGMFSFIHVDDAAAATVAAVERGALGVFNVVDDEPAPMREWLPVYARSIGARPPRRVPLWLARLLAGRMITSMASTLPGASNARAKAELGWSPRWPSWREGFDAAPR
jgi:2-alkyl-3-oxoalkanoate reductase